jgi:2-polyprenyl-3-methyl-5-hydroxy-6-metoxy-1,4-benzoquinol methylase
MLDDMMRMVRATETANRGLTIDYRAVYDKQYEENPLYGDDMQDIGGHAAKLPRIKGYLAALPGKSVIDVGCGQGIYLRALKDDHEVFGIEPSTVACERYLADIPHQNTDIAGFQPARAFDIVLCVDVLEHIAETDDALRKIRSLAPAAVLGIATNSDHHLGVELHITQQPSAWWRERLERLYPVVTIDDPGTAFFWAVCAEAGMYKPGDATG